MTREKFFREVSALALELPRAVYYNFAAAAQDFVCHLESQIPRWRSVERDRLPERGRHFDTLIFDDERIIPAEWYGKRMVELVGGRDNNSFTHWLPLSDLPEPTEE